MNLAGEWYTSGTLWAAGAVVVALLVGILTVVVTYMVGFPKRRLLYGVPVATPLLTTPDGVLRGELELRHRGELLTEPHVVELKLLSKGRKDIPSTAYDGGAPIRLDVGARIIEILQTSSTPSTLAPPRVAVDGTALAIGPSLLGRHQGISFTLLVEGSPCLTLESSLVDVDVKEASNALAERSPLEESVRTALLTGGGVMVAAVVAGAMGFLFMFVNGY